MNLYLIWKYKYWIAIAVLSFICIGQLAYTNHLGGELIKAETQCQQKIQKLKDDQQKEMVKAQDKANQASADYEKLKSEQRVKNEVVIKEVQKIIDRPVYRNICIDAHGVSAINSLIPKNTS
ncbi:hypothetical protein [Acinetobacter rudis]|uniref:DUF2570 domain-containing protein n=1 Tax=Acinetobacter rudis CIP 110305 TaxID=421052 RepID=S3NZB6_9GAMM|nr:hypothetical protein [Acinetobacter rudis]EPF71946.1 hypothetical protein F945_02292 [Acinetobacter rudis CIP 110305]